MSFTKAYNDTMDTEGGYVHDPTDRGGETYKGISRRYNPQWEGWLIVDSYKPFTSGFGVLYNDTMLDTLTRKFYRENYWDKPGFERIDKMFPLLAEKLFDTGVNVGIGRVSKWLQSTLNLLNRNQLKYNDIKVDGGIGPKTLKTLEKAMSCNPKNRILSVIVVHQGEHYKKLMERDKTQERYVGWFDRLEYK